MKKFNFDFDDVKFYLKEHIIIRTLIFLGLTLIFVPITTALWMTGVNLIDVDGGTASVILMFFSVILAIITIIFVACFICSFLSVICSFFNGE